MKSKNLGLEETTDQRIGNRVLYFSETRWCVGSINFRKSSITFTEVNNGRYYISFWRNQRNFSNKSLGMSSGKSATATPAFLRTSTLAAAVLVPEEMMAPA